MLQGNIRVLERVAFVIGIILLHIIFKKNCVVHMETDAVTAQWKMPIYFPRWCATYSVRVELATP